MRKTFHTSLSLAGALASAALLFASSPVQQKIAEADARYAHRNDPKEAQAALTAYKEAIVLDPHFAEAQWKASRICYWIADHASRRQDKLKYFQDGIDFAKAGIAEDPNSIDSHFWLGGNYGSYGEVKGILKSLALVKPIRKEMETVVRLNDHYQGGGGYRVLGIVDYKVPGFAGGNKKRSLEYLNKALATDPANGFTQYYLAEYFKTVGEKAKAKEHLDTLRSLKPTPDVDPLDLEMIQEKGERLRKDL